MVTLNGNLIQDGGDIYYSISYFTSYIQILHTNLYNKLYIPNILINKYRGQEG